jgi:hypothetical protein
MATPAEVINQAVADAIAKASTFTDQVDIAADRVLGLSEGRSTGSSYYVPVTNITAVEPTIPPVDDALLIYDAELNHLIKLLSDELAAYFAKYYPLASDAFDEATSWLVNTITNGGTGIPQAIEDQIWQRARERIIREGQRLESTITSSYAARGFSLVQGPMIHDLNQARNEQAGRIGEASTAIAAKQAEIAIETIKFAITTAIDSRFKAMNAAADYIRAIASAPDAASRLVSTNSDAKAKMMDATAGLYRARLSRDELVIRSQSDRMQTDSHFALGSLDAFQKQIDGEVRAAAAAADAYAKVAQSYIAQFNGVMSATTSAFS